jgi:hypothetical protein
MDMTETRFTEDQLDEISDLIKYGISEEYWEDEDDVRVLVKGDPDWGKIDQDLDYVVPLPSLHRGWGSVYGKTVWGDQLIRVIYSQLDRSTYGAEIFILSEEAYTMCTNSQIDWLLKEF